MYRYTADDDGGHVGLLCLEGHHPRQKAQGTQGEEVERGSGAKEQVMFT
jgi:hypothetical protein